MHTRLAETSAKRPVSNAGSVTGFVLDANTRALPPHVLEAARFCIVDWFGVAIGARDYAAIQALHRVVQGWHTQGRAQVLLDGTTAPGVAALINGTMAHCLDFDDTHVGSIAHLSGPAWAAAFAVGTHLNAKPVQILNAFVTGFEVGARLGCGGFGIATNERHIHATGVFGCFAATVAASVLYGLDEIAIQRALGLAATQVGGLTGSFGTPAKPFHAGKAAFNGVLSAEMAYAGYDAALDMIEPGGGLDRALVQDGASMVPAMDFGDGWEITRNTFKPYASCLLTHPVIDAAKDVGATLDLSRIRTIQVRVNPLAIQLAGIGAPTTPYEGKFSLAFCTALALSGRTVTQGDFTASNMVEPLLRDLVAKVELVAVDDMAVTAARFQATLHDGTTVNAHTPMALGNPERPMGWKDMERKFHSLVAPAIGDEAAAALFACLRTFDDMQSLDAVRPFLTRSGGWN
ncbi:MmgE/PrpD family protein [Bordetella sp. BOR01]|uniref:MmgE/PrpD family protein n=1 Tax=Bordetella sp. BOR01 TaxID=2854779 RepID=UPI001C4371BF|nr:MmgE/PrpD family protein [Bordetella sp. BOR01]MBV7483193.1 MmgE/PrpD family protein [Bordetella sp. BOR01]